LETFKDGLLRELQTRGIEACQRRRRSRHRSIVLAEKVSGQAGGARMKSTARAAAANAVELWNRLSNYGIDALIRSISSRTSRSATEETISATVSRTMRSE